MCLYQLKYFNIYQSGDGLHTFVYVGFQPFEYLTVHYAQSH